VATQWNSCLKSSKASNLILKFGFVFINHECQIPSIETKSNLDNLAEAFQNWRYRRNQKTEHEPLIIDMESRLLEGDYDTVRKTTCGVLALFIARSRRSKDWEDGEPKAYYKGNSFSSEAARQNPNL
jgi:hypothetical protein